MSAESSHVDLRLNRLGPSPCLRAIHNEQRLWARRELRTRWQAGWRWVRCGSGGKISVRAAWRSVFSHFEKTNASTRRAEDSAPYLAARNDRLCRTPPIASERRRFELPTPFTLAIFELVSEQVARHAKVRHSGTCPFLDRRWKFRTRVHCLRPLRASGFSRTFVRRYSHGPTFVSSELFRARRWLCSRHFGRALVSRHTSYVEPSCRRSILHRDTCCPVGLRLLVIQHHVAGLFTF